MVGGSNPPGPTTSKFLAMPLPPSNQKGGQQLGMDKEVRATMD